MSKRNAQHDPAAGWRELATRYAAEVVAFAELVAHDPFGGPAAGVHLRLGDLHDAARAAGMAPHRRPTLSRCLRACVDDMLLQIGADPLSEADLDEARAEVCR